ncbi:YdaS family helix-turn-helix protein [Aureimonas sp. SA4125]|uniref:transcriptional regulator n=1 Tax=Aureimonas sp. SA4125 TaxID=2826993 RepID=UPI001CC426C1|nr:YdaS family helix-turn-helix protein [Aureimonas sp. SA4125]
MADALYRAIQKAGGPSAVARSIAIKPQAVSQWTVCPTIRVLEVEAFSGVSRHELRPDIYPSEAAA